MAARYPDDTTVASVYAEALMNTMPQITGALMGEAKPDTQAAVIASLEAVMAADPDHPLALHLYIHALEASSNVAKAEPAADRLANCTGVGSSGAHAQPHLLQSGAVSGFRARQHARSRGGRGLHRPMQCAGLLSCAVLPSQHSLPVASSTMRVNAHCLSTVRGGWLPVSAVEQVEQFSDYSIFPHRADALFSQVCAVGGNSCGT